MTEITRIAELVRWRWHRIRGGWRCKIGLHRLRGYQDLGDGVHVAPASPHGKPGPRTWRKCDWCGATWKAAYDPPYGGFWQRTR